VTSRGIGAIKSEIAGIFLWKKLGKAERGREAGTAVEKKLETVRRGRDHRNPVKVFDLGSGRMAD